MVWVELGKRRRHGPKEDFGVSGQLTRGIRSVRNNLWIRNIQAVNE
jgi:hypothetical protein